MKRVNILYFLILIGWSVQAQTPELDKLIDFSVKNASIEFALNQLKDMSALSLSFSHQIIPNQKLTLVEKQKKVGFILQEILKNTNLKYQIIGTQIVIVEQNLPPPNIPKFTISGSLEDETTGEKLIGANIFDALSQQGTTSNEYGFFSFTLPAGQKKIVFSYLGYEAQIKKINLQQNQVLTVSLSPALTLVEIVVRDVDTSLNTSSSDVFSENISIEMLQSLPSLMGEPDLHRSIQLMTGVQTGPDGVGGLHVRGGSMDQNLSLIDGVPVYNPSHTLGIFSIFNTDVIRKARLIKGGFPARYSGRLSSILDVRTKEGNFKSFHGQTSLSLLSGKFTLEGPIKKDTTSFLISGRSSFVNAYLKPFTRWVKETRGEEGVASYHFYDINAKLNHKFSSTSQIYLGFYKGSDDFKDRVEISSPVAFINSVTGDTIATGQSDYFSSRRIKYGNTIGSLRWNKMWTKNLFSNTTLTFSDYRFEDEYIERDSLELAGQTITKDLTVLKNHSGIQDIAAKIDFDYVPDLNHYVRFGANIVQHKFVPGVIAYHADSEEEGEVELTEIALSNDSINSREYNFYIEDEVKLGNQVQVNFGTHLSTFRVGTKTYNSIQPRFAITWKLNPKTSLNGSISRMTQFLHLLNSSNIGLTTDLWVPSTEQIAPSKAWQYDLGWAWRLKKNWHVDASIYYKHMTDLITYTEGANILTDWENNVTNGEGIAYGFEFSLKKNVGKTTGWLAYSFSYAKRNFERNNFDAIYPYRFDRRHDVHLVLVHRFNDKWELSGDWSYGTGLTFTAPVNKYPVAIPGSISPPEVIINRPSRNNQRMPAYHRLDISANYLLRKKRTLTKFTFGAYNVYNERSPLYFAYRRRPTETNLFNQEFVVAELLPIMPVASISISW